MYTRFPERKSSPFSAEAASEIDFAGESPSAGAP